MEEGHHRTSADSTGSVAAPFRRKPLRELERDLQAAESTSSLPRVLGPAALIFFGVGGIIGGIMVARFGIMPMLLVGALLVAVTNLVFAWLATVGASLPALTAVLMINIAFGVITRAAPQLV